MNEQDILGIKLGISKLEGNVSRLTDSMDSLKENIEQQLKGFADATAINLKNNERRISNLEANQKWFVMTLIAESVALVISFIKILS